MLALEFRVQGLFLGVSREGGKIAYRDYLEVICSLVSVPN